MHSSRVSALSCITHSRELVKGAQLLVEAASHMQILIVSVFGLCS